MATDGMTGKGALVALTAFELPVGLLLAYVAIDAWRFAPWPSAALASLVVVALWVFVGSFLVKEWRGRR